MTETKSIVLAACVAVFCIAMGLREYVNIWIGTGAAAILSMFFLWIGARPSVKSAVTRPVLGSAVVGVAVGIAMAFATWWLYPIGAELFPPVEGEVETLYALLRQPPGPIRAFLLLLLVVATEELVWRGLAIDVFAKAVGPWRAVLFAALTYVLPQLAFRSPLLMLIALICGVVWGILRVRSNGVVAPLMAHIVWNLLVFVLHPVA